MIEKCLYWEEMIQVPLLVLHPGPVWVSLDMFLQLLRPVAKPVRSMPNLHLAGSFECTTQCFVAFFTEKLSSSQLLSVGYPGMMVFPRLLDYAALFTAVSVL